MYKVRKDKEKSNTLPADDKIEKFNEQVNAVKDLLQLSKDAYPARRHHTYAAIVIDAMGHVHTCILVVVIIAIEEVVVVVVVVVVVSVVVLVLVVVVVVVVCQW